MNAVYNQKKVVKVTYCHEDFFRIPTNIDLENKDQVEEWWVKWNTLYIKLKDIEEVVQIESEGLEQDMKYPDDQTIEDADDHFAWGNEDFVRVDLNTGKIEECFVRLPEEIVSHVLSFRPRHPLAQIILDFKERAVAEAETEHYEGDQSIFDESLHKLISYTQEGELFWKNTLGDDDPDKYCWRVRRDYDAVYNGDWNYGCAPWLGLYEDPTQPKPRWDYSPEAYADPVQRKKEWTIYHRRLTGNDPKVYK
jgi:hypothetical protein